MKSTGTQPPHTATQGSALSQMWRTNVRFKHLALILFGLGFVNIGAWVALVPLGFCYVLVMLWRSFRAHILAMGDVAFGRVALLASRPSRYRPYGGGGAADSSGCGD